MSEATVKKETEFTFRVTVETEASSPEAAILKVPELIGLDDGVGGEEFQTLVQDVGFMDVSRDKWARAAEQVRNRYRRASGYRDKLLDSERREAELWRDNTAKDIEIRQLRHENNALWDLLTSVRGAAVALRARETRVSSDYEPSDEWTEEDHLRSGGSPSTSRTGEE